MFGPKKNTKVFLSVVAFSCFSSNCGRPIVQTSSDKVTDIQHTPVKRQALGNCWIYATATWAESLHLAATSETINLSESYWTYWDWYNKLMTSGTATPLKLNTSGTWQVASDIIRNYGWMREGDFIPTEDTSEMSQTQAQAEMAVERELQVGGRLARPEQRTSQNVMAALDSAFGVNISTLWPKRRQAFELIVDRDQIGNWVGLDSVIASSTNWSWNQFSYPVVHGQGVEPAESTKVQRKDMLRRVLRALNDHRPVMMSFMVDFNAIKTTPYATFDLQTLKENGMGHQGGHLVVLEDYVVENVPGVGSLGEGDMSPELKAKALEGDLVYLKAKNSWGTNRPERGLTDGYTAFRMDYLNANLPWSTEQSGSDPNRTYWQTALNGFVLPPGY